MAKALQRAGLIAAGGIGAGARGAPADRMGRAAPQPRLAALELRPPGVVAGAGAEAPPFVPPSPQSGADFEQLLRETRRRKIWELSETLHCSIIGTCLPAGELRQLLARLDSADADTASDHDLHGKGVLLARNRDAGGKLLNKTLDRRHHVAVNQFAKARDEAAVGGLWAEAVKRGDIPGAYWAVLTHPATGDVLLRKVFGEVHMLSHLMGAANRADIRRLHQLEQENAALLAKVGRQQAQLCGAATAREAALSELAAALSVRAEAGAPREQEEEAPTQVAGLPSLVAALERRLAAEARGRERLERRLEESALSRAETETARRRAEGERDALSAELAAAEAALASLLGAGEKARTLDLSGLSLLYVGGRANHVFRLRALAEQASARFLHHDGGIDERSGILPGLINRADVALFPVDCVSHEAATLVKRLCRQSGKPWIPLRSASIAAFLAAVEALQSERAAAPAES